MVVDTGLFLPCAAMAHTQKEEEEESVRAERRKIKCQTPEDVCERSKKEDKMSNPGRCV